MNEWERNRRLAEPTRKAYPPGTRILLNHMDDPRDPVRAGMRGTVRFVDDQSQIHIQWDNGRGLALIPGVDSFRKLTQEELVQECVPLQKGSFCIVDEDGCSRFLKKTRRKRCAQSTWAASRQRPYMIGNGTALW